MAIAEPFLFQKYQKDTPSGSSSVNDETVKRMRTPTVIVVSLLLRLHLKPTILLDIKLIN